MKTRNIIIYCLLTSFVMTTFGAYLIIQHSVGNGTNVALIGGFLHGLIGIYLLVKQDRVKQFER